MADYFTLFVKKTLENIHEELDMTETTKQQHKRKPIILKYNYQYVKNEVH